jgi:hypothetical protein
MALDYIGLRNPFGGDDAPTLSMAESEGVLAVYRAAKELEQLLTQYDELSGLTASGKTVLDRCYREMRRTVETYLGSEHSLWYAPKPGTPFQKREGKE